MSLCGYGLYGIHDGSMNISREYHRFFTRVSRIFHVSVTRVASCCHEGGIGVSLVFSLLFVEVVTSKLDCNQQIDRGQTLLYYQLTLLYP